MKKVSFAQFMREINPGCDREFEKLKKEVEKLKAQLKKCKERKKR